MRLAIAKFLHKWSQLWIDRNCKPGICFVAINDNAPRLQIDIGARDRSRFRLSESSQSEKLYKVAALLCVPIKLLRPNVSHDLQELFKVGVNRIGLVRVRYFKSFAGLSMMILSFTAMSKASRIRVSAAL